MGFFDPPAIALRKIIPQETLGDFNVTEEFALHNLRDEPPQRKPYQLGVVLAVWIKAGLVKKEISLTPRDDHKVQALYEKCVKILGEEAYWAFSILAELADQDHTFGIPSRYYRMMEAHVTGIPIDPVSMIEAMMGKSD